MPGIWDGTELHAISTEIKSALHPEKNRIEERTAEVNQQQHCSCSLMMVGSLFCSAR